jgi:DNA-directed RNA polymerase subunit RPC12/RpoP
MKFERPKGFAGSIPRNYIDRQLPRCPFCGTDRPQWEVAMQYSLRGTRYHYRCTKCQGSLSILMTAVSHAGGVGAMIITAGSSKDLLVESTGRSGSELGVGREYSPAILREKANIAIRPAPSPPKVQPIEPRTVYACPNCDRDVSEHDKECPYCHTAFED